MYEILIASIIIMLASLSGVVFLWKFFGNFLEKNIHYITSFSAGVFLIVSLNLAHETFKLSTKITEGFLWILVGVLILIGIFKLVPLFHHHHNKDQDRHKHTGLDARKILFSDSIHNLGDGILLTASFGVSVELGIVTTFGIFVHEFIQEISEFFVLKESGYSSEKALILNFLTAGTILLGATGSFYATEYFHFLELPLLGIAAGSFLVVVFNDLIPNSVHYSSHSKKHTEHVMAFLVGVFLILGLNGLTGDTHAHEDLSEVHTHESEHHHDEHDH